MVLLLEVEGEALLKADKAIKLYQDHLISWTTPNGDVQIDRYDVIMANKKSGNW